MEFCDQVRPDFVPKSKNMLVFMFYRQGSYDEREQSDQGGPVNGKKRGGSHLNWESEVALTCLNSTFLVGSNGSVTFWDSRSL